MSVGVTMPVNLTPYVDKATYDSDLDGKFDEAIFKLGLFPRTLAHKVRKIASNDLRHSIDAIVTNSSGSTAWRKDKTLVFTNGIKGTLRIAFEMIGQSGSDCGKVTDKDGNLLGVAKDGTNCAVYQTHSQDVAVDFEAGGELQLHSSDNGCTTGLKNFRVYYINDATATPDAVAVTGAD